MTVVQLIVKNDRQKIKKLGVKLPKDDATPERRYGTGKSASKRFYKPPALSEVCPLGSFRIPANKKLGWFIEVVLWLVCIIINVSLQRGRRPITGRGTTKTIRRSRRWPLAARKRGNVGVLRRVCCRKSFFFHRKEVFHSSVWCVWAWWQFIMSSRFSLKRGRFRFFFDGEPVANESKETPQKEWVVGILWSTVFEWLVGCIFLSLGLGPWEAQFPKAKIDFETSQRELLVFSEDQYALYAG